MVCSADGDNDDVDAMLELASVEEPPQLLPLLAPNCAAWATGYEPPATDAVVGVESSCAIRHRKVTKPVKQENRMGEV